MINQLVFSDNNQNLYRNQKRWTMYSHFSKKYLSFLCILCFLNLKAQPVSSINGPVIDERVELVSIVFRLAGNKEYSSDSFRRYSEAIEKHFGKYREHKVVALARKLREENGLGFSEVMKMPVQLKSLQEMTPVVPFTELLPGSGWGLENARNFKILLEDFYTTSNAQSFFKEHQSLYRLAEDRFKNVSSQLDSKWYKEFYGIQSGDHFNIILGLGNGGANYGTDLSITKSSREVYAIMGTWKIDSLGQPFYERDDYLPTLLHEFNHSYVNAVTDQNREKFRKAGKKLFASVQEEMRLQAYTNWETILNEALVRAAVIKYMKDHHFDSSAIEKEQIEQVEKGFYWIKELVVKLEEYAQGRNRYSSLHEFVPELAEFYEKIAPQVIELKKNYEKKRPKVTSLSEFMNNSTKVDPDIKSITVNFDQPLSGQGVSISYSEKGNKYFPRISNVQYSNDNRSVIIFVDLEKGRHYEMLLNGRSFRSKNGVPIRTYPINFTTAK